MVTSVHNPRKVATKAWRKPRKTHNNKVYVDHVWGANSIVDIKISFFDWFLQPQHKRHGCSRQTCSVQLPEHPMRAHCDATFAIQSQQNCREFVHCCNTQQNEAKNCDDAECAFLSRDSSKRLQCKIIENRLNNKVVQGMRRAALRQAFWLMAQVIQPRSKWYKTRM